MTEEQKEILIARIIDNPSSLSDDDLKAILSDEELRDIYDISSALSGAYIHQPEMDMAEEWKLFSKHIHPKPTKMRWIMRVAAIFLGVLFVSGIVVKIIDYSFMPDIQPSEANMAHTLQTENVLTIKSSIRPSEPQEIKPTYTTIQGKQAAASSQHHVSTKTAMPKPKREPEETNIDIDEFLRIQQARIDNDIAVQVAEAYMEEYYRLLPILEATGINNPYIDNVIRKTTMQ